MKFNNGYWLLKEGVACFSPQQIQFVRKNKKELILCTPTSKVFNRGMAIDGINLTVRITCPMPEVIRIQAWHHMGVKKRGPEFELNLPEPPDMTVTEEADSLTVINGGLSLVIGKEDWPCI